ncbi:MAG: hypothetical protein Q8O13_11065 [Candidatus Omnitrophota bacterium]|nr:hypothetical protein [Candidatus Omnitrophota bacterium]
MHNIRQSVARFIKVGKSRIISDKVAGALEGIAQILVLDIHRFAGSLTFSILKIYELYSENKKEELKEAVTKIKYWLAVLKPYEEWSDSTKQELEALSQGVGQKWLDINEECIYFLIYLATSQFYGHLNEKDTKNLIDKVVYYYFDVYVKSAENIHKKDNPDVDFYSRYSKSDNPLQIFGCKVCNILGKECAILLTQVIFHAGVFAAFLTKFIKDKYLAKI